MGFNFQENVAIILTPVIFSKNFQMSANVYAQMPVHVDFWRV